MEGEAAETGEGVGIRCIEAGLWFGSPTPSQRRYVYVLGWRDISLNHKGCAGRCR